MKISFLKRFLNLFKKTNIVVLTKGTMITIFAGETPKDPARFMYMMIAPKKDQSEWDALVGEMNRVYPNITEYSITYMSKLPNREYRMGWVYDHEKARIIISDDKYWGQV